MNCLVIASTVMEIAPFLQELRGGSVKGDIDVLITGIGLTATTYALTRQVGIKKPGMIIQAGVAGSFENNYLPGSVVVIRQDTVADLGVIEKKQWRTVFDLGLVKSGHAPYKNEWLSNPNKALIKNSGLKAVNAISINQISTLKSAIDNYKNKFLPAVESMEGAALHFVALMEKIPFLQIRAVSNYVGDRDKKKWKLRTAIENLNKELLRIVADNRSKN